MVEQDVPLAQGIQQIGAALAQGRGNRSGEALFVQSLHLGLDQDRSNVTNS